jgi:cytoskeleton protein RodZ
MTEHQQEPVVETHSANLGEQLRQAREHKKYSVAEVAAQLRLTKSIVGYLESQEWDKLNGRTYARGYFASYARFLGLPHDEMLAVFDLEYSATEPTLNLNPHRHSVDDKPFPWLMLLFVVIVLGSGWFAYQQWQAIQMESQSIAPEQVEQASELQSSVVEPIASNDVPMVEQEVLPEPLAVNEGDEMADSPALNQDEPSFNEADLSLNEDDLSEISAAESMPPESVPVEVLPPTETIETESEQQTATATLKLSFSGDCWVEVSNADAKVLVSKVMRAQDSLELSSEQPLRVLLGRAEVATVIFNNEPVDLSPYTKGNVARLTLGVES